MNLKQENDLLEQARSVAEEGYEKAYRFLLGAYEKAPGEFGPQTLYFLACLSGGAGLSGEALGWLRTSIRDNGWWYRPEVLIDDDLAALEEDPEFLALRAASDERYSAAVRTTQAELSWQSKTASRLFLAVHGNTQNAQTAAADWTPVLVEDASWQLETVQSAEPDGFGTFRWSYDQTSYLPVAAAMEKLQAAGYEKIVCGGFSAGCDMLLRAVTFADARCDALILQSPWLPVLEEHAAEAVSALQKKGVVLRILCGAEDEDCLPLAETLFAQAKKAGLDVTLTVQEASRHQFPEKPYALRQILSGGAAHE